MGLLDFVFGDRKARRKRRRKRAARRVGDAGEEAVEGAAEGCTGGCCLEVPLVLAVGVEVGRRLRARR